MICAVWVCECVYVCSPLVADKKLTASTSIPPHGDVYLFPSAALLPRRVGNVAL